MTLEHVAIVMDGNGRWAEQRRLPRIEGHRAGAEALRGIVLAAAEMGLAHLTVFAFSTENWKRGEAEVDPLIKLIQKYFVSEQGFLQTHAIRVRVIGERDGLAPSIVDQMTAIEATTGGNTGLNLFVALNYGGRNEIIHMARRAAHAVADGALTPDAISEDLLASYAFAAGTPDPDLIIRTSGEMRLSNFLLWQSAYAEFDFIDVLWPDFTPKCFGDAIGRFEQRKRRYGGL